MINIIRLKDLPEGSGLLSNDDILVFMDDPSGSGTTKKITFGEISNLIGSGITNPITIVGGDYISSNLIDDTYTISVTGLQPSGNYSIIGHSHQISDVSGLQTALDNKQPSGIYASGIHSHSSSDITNFNSSVSGLLPVTNITAGSYISVSSSSGNFTVSATGLQPSGNYSISGHTHLSTDITDSTSFGRNILTATSYEAQNKLGWQEIDSSSFQAKAGGQYFVKPVLFAALINYAVIDPISPSVGDFFTIVKYPNSQPTVIGGITYSYDQSILIYRVYQNTNFDLLNPTFGWVTYTLNSFHTHTSSDITNFNTAVSGLLPVKNIIAGTGIDVINSSGIYTITSTGSSIISDQSKSLVTTVFNKTGSPIPKMSAVYINGGQGDLPTVSLAIATSDMTSAGTYGLTYETIPNMQSGKVIVFGALTDLDTDQFNPTAPQGDVNGSVLYLSPSVSGSLTLTKPSAPNHIVAIGTIVRTHQNEGVIEVRVQNGFELEELHNVAISGVADGQFLQYNSNNSLWIPSSSGNFSSLTVNNTGVSLVGHTHASTDISDFNNSVNNIINTSLSTDIVAGTGVSISYDNINDDLIIGLNGFVPVVSLGTLTGSNAINGGMNNAYQTLTLNGTATTLIKSAIGWPTTSSQTTETILKITVTSATTITWTIVTEWFNQPPAGALAIGTHLFLLRGVGTSVVEGHYIGNKTN